MNNITNLRESWHDYSILSHSINPRLGSGGRRVGDHLGHNLNAALYNLMEFTPPLWILTQFANLEALIQKIEIYGVCMFARDKWRCL